MKKLILLVVVLVLFAGQIFAGEFDDYKGLKWAKDATGWMINTQVVKTSYVVIGYYYNNVTHVTEMKPIIKQGDDTVKRAIKTCSLCNELMHYKRLFPADPHARQEILARQDYIVVNDALEIHPKCWEKHVVRKIKGIR